MAPPWSGVRQKLCKSLFWAPARIQWWWVHLERLQLAPDLGPKTGPGALPVPFQVPLTDRRVLAGEMFGNVFSAAVGVSGRSKTSEKCRMMAVAHLWYATEGRLRPAQGLSEVGMTPNLRRHPKWATRLVLECGLGLSKAYASGLCAR